jgi:phytoene synthase
MTAAHAARATRLYGFCRYVDDLADESSAGQDPRAALALVAQGIASGSSQNPIVADAIALMRECGIQPALITTFIDGITSDLDTVRIADEGALLRYCYQAAGTVGSMMCRVLGSSDPAALRHAIDLGIAMQLTNICRDVQADATAGRRYLPASLIGDLDPQALVDPARSLQPRLQACIGHLLDTADRYYRSGEAGLAHLPVGARCSILIAARVYRAIGTQLRQQDNAYWLGRTVVPRRTKSLVTLRALVSLPSLAGFWMPARQHDPELHRCLSPLLGTDTPTQGQHV